MSRRRDTGTAGVDFVKASGRIHEVFANLARKGVPPDFWGSVLTDDRFADQVANALLSLVPNASVSLEKLIAAAKASGALTCVNDYITSANFPVTAVRDGLVLIDLHLSGWFSTQRALDTLDSLGHHPATMIEGTVFADDGWDRKTPVAILGSVGRSSYGLGCVGYLWSGGARRRLDLSHVVGGGWNGHYRFLAVPKKVKK